ncbi:MAG: hypothetical protein QM762_14770 [Chryseolinea sp.]
MEMKQFATDIPKPMLTNKVFGLTIGLFLTTLSHFSYSQTSPATPSSTHLGAMVKQTVKESWADIEPLGQDRQGVYYLGIPYEEMYSGPIANDDFHLFLVNNDAELIKRNLVNFNIEGVKSRYEFTHEIGGKIIVFTSLERKDERVVSFYAQELDRDMLQLGTPKKIVELSFAQIKKNYNRASFKSELSHDKSKLLISYGLVDDDRGLLSFGFVVLGNSVNQLSKWSGNLNMTDGFYLFDRFCVSNKGDVFLQTRYFENENDRYGNTTLRKSQFISSARSMQYGKNYEYRVVKFENGTSKIFAIPNKNKFYDVLDMDIAPDGDLILIGFYSQLEDDSMPIGAATLKVNPKSGAMQESMKEFGNSYEMPSDIEDKNSTPVSNKEQYIRYRFIVSEIQFNSNGGYTLIGERNFTHTKRTQQVDYTVNHLDDLAVVDVAASGKINSVFKVEKSQQAEDAQLFNASYYYVENNNNKYIAFANMGKSSFRESVLVTIAPDGNQKREVMFSTKDADVTIKPKDCKFYNGNLLMYGSKNNRYVRWMSRHL